MKKRRIILSSLSALLVIILVIGSTGITLDIHSCNSCGISVDARIFKSASLPEDNCCSRSDLQCPSGSLQTPEIGCCTFTTRELKLTNYIPVEPVIFSSIAGILPVYNIPFVAGSEKQPAFPIVVHNKHGGRLIVISNCQYLI